MALMMGAQPIFVFLFGRFLGSRDRWTWLAALGLAIGFAGVAVAFWSPGADSGAHSVLGRAFALAAASPMERARSSPARRRGRSAP